MWHSLIGLKGDFFSIRRLGVLVALVFAVPGWTSEMPFSADYVISGDFDGASSVISVDMDRDGDLDVAAASRWGGTVNWWESPGGTLHTVATGFTEAYDLAVGDFNGDGLPDLVGAARSASGSNVRWWANPGPGVPGLWPETNVSSAYLTQALSVDAGDIDGDGDDDIVAAGYHSSVDGVFMWFGNRNGDGASFDIYDIGTSYDTPHSVHLADVDGDSMIDLLGTTFGGDQVLWFRNDGSIISADPWPVETIWPGVDGAICVRGSDIDGDGDLDVAVAAFEAGDLLWYENSGATPPTWDQHVVETSFAGVYSVEPVDLDRDGDLDLLASARTDDAIRWWEHSGVSWYEHSIDDAFDGARSAVAADLDLDGDLDVVAAADEADDVTWWENRNVHRDARFTTKTTVTTGTGEYTGVGALDVDGDGKLDIVAVASNDDDYGDVMLFLQGATSASWTTVEIDDAVSGAASLRVTDLNGDLFEDLLVTAAGDDEILAYWNNGNGSFFSSTIASGFVGASDAEAADIDGDGDMDVVGVAETAGLLRWWEREPNGPIFWEQHNFAPMEGASAVAIGDLNGDFEPDVVAVSASEGELTWYESLGEAGNSWLWTPRTLTTGLSAPRAVVIGDFSGDGRMDIAAAGSTGEPEFWLWINQGGTPPTWSLTTHSGPWDANGGVSSLAAVDIDLDGDLDLMAVLSSDQMAGVWKNPDGADPSWSWEDIASFDGAIVPLAVGSGDIDRDGDPDAVVVGNDDVTFARNQGGQFSISAWAEPDVQVGDGEMTILMEIAPNHLGRSGDLALELEWLNLAFERENGTPMDEIEINALVERLYVFHDSNANSILEIGVDPLLAVEATIEMVSPGYVQLPIPHGSVNPPLIPSPREYFFLVAEMTDDASSVFPSCFRAVHMAGGSVTALRYDLYDIDPKPSWFSSVEGGLVCSASLRIFADGFESGGTSAWAFP